MAHNLCSVRLCNLPADSESPITCMKLCSNHLKPDLLKMEESESIVGEKIAHFKKFQAPMRLMQQRLASDLQLLDDTFHELKETLDKCQAELSAAIKKHHDELLESLAVLSGLEDFERELTAAKTKNDLRQTFVINEGMRQSLQDTIMLSSKLVSIEDNDGNDEVRMVPFPDMIFPIKYLQARIQVQLGMACLIVENIEETPGSRRRLGLSSKVETVELDGCLQSKAVCTNTSDFAINNSGNVIRDSQSGTKLTNTAVFVSIVCYPHRYNDSDESDAEENDAETKVFLVSTEPVLIGRVACCWDSDQPIRDLHCDNDRQLLFIAQPHAVTIADFSGVQKSKIRASDLQANINKIRCITGDCDKLFILAELTDQNTFILFVSKETNQVEKKMKLPDSCSLLLTQSNRISVRDQFLFLSDSVDVFTICCITGLIVASQRLESIDAATEGLAKSPDFGCSLSGFYHDSNLLLRFSTLLAKSMSTARILYLQRDAMCCRLVELSEDEHTRQEALYLVELSIEMTEHNVEPDTRRRRRNVCSKDFYHKVLV